MKNIFNMIDSAEDELIEFDERYNKNSVKKLKQRKEFYSNHDLFSSWINENKKVIDNLSKNKLRPEVMEKFDEVFTSHKSLEFLKETKKSGKKIIGTMCNLIPEELIYASDCIPVRLCLGHNESIRAGEEAYPRDSCSLIKSSFGYFVADQGFFNLCDAIVVPACCDGKKKLAEISNNYKKTLILDLPQNKDKHRAKKYWNSEVRIFKKELENISGNNITKKKLKESILLLEKRYSVVRKLLDLRKKSLILGSDFFIFVQAAFFMDIHEWIALAEQLIIELEENLDKNLFVKKNAIKILLTGSPILMPNFKIPTLIENFDAVIAMDAMCSGTQHMYDPVVIEEWSMVDMLNAISEKYFMPSVCPCFIKSEDRIDRLLNLVKEYNIDAVIHHTIRLCLLFDIESFRVRDIMEENNIPLLSLNTDYSPEDLGQLKTRIEAFIEVVSAQK